MVLEYGDIDLARLLAKHEKAQREGGVTDLDENFIRLYWQQMLQVVLFMPPFDHCSDCLAGDQLQHSRYISNFLL